VTEAPAPAGQHTVREHNLKLVLAELVAGPGSRAELAQRTGLTKATVASLVDTVIEQGILLEADPEVSGPGRPSRILSFHPEGPVAVGVEINIDYTAICELDLTGKLIRHEQHPVDNRVGTLTGVLRHTARICRAFVQGGRRPLLGVGLGVPAVVSPDGQVLRAPNLPVLNGESIGPSFSQQLGLNLGAPVIVENEANLGALARLRSAPDAGQDFVYVSGEIGVGAGLIVEGELFRGLNGFAGELGHVVVDRDGPACGCGGQGCVEQYAGQDVLLRAARQPDVEALLAAIARRDSRALGAADRAGAALGVGLASLLNVVDLPMVVLGGVYARLFDAITPSLQAELGRRVLSSGRGGGQIRRSSLGVDAAVRGAAGLVIDRALKEPRQLAAGLQSG
jgi:predicted NBD/HSP70 family sugar kinase